MALDSIDSYPLQWPAGWKRSSKQIESRFGGPSNRVTIAAARDFVIAELGRMGIPSWNIIISSNLRLRNDGLPYSKQAEPEDGGISVWWRAEGAESRKVIALDRYTRAADNLHAIGKTVEAMRGIDRWGSGEILERTFEGFAALPDPAKVSWREILGYYGELQAECRNYYVRKIKESHPDNGGSASAAAAVNDAWSAAKVYFKSKDD